MRGTWGLVGIQGLGCRAREPRLERHKSKPGDCLASLMNSVVGVADVEDSRGLHCHTCPVRNFMRVLRAQLRKWQQSAVSEVSLDAGSAPSCRVLYLPVIQPL